MFFLSLMFLFSLTVLFFSSLGFLFCPLGFFFVLGVSFSSLTVFSGSLHNSCERRSHVGSNGSDAFF